uniref:beta strand repeat-containing protein n=1 Tax=Aestuariivirga sp. TaxID=2650926 RepID=UPI003593C01A
LVLTPAEYQAIIDAFDISPDTAQNNSGTVNWTYTIDEAKLDFLGAGEIVTAVFTITLTDDSGQSSADGPNEVNRSSQDVTITIRGATIDEPVISIQAGDTATVPSPLSDPNTFGGFFEAPDKPNGVLDDGISVKGTLTVRDVDTTDVVDMTVVGVTFTTVNSPIIPSYISASSNALLKSFLTLKETNGSDANDIPAEVTDKNNVTWTFNSGIEPFDFLAEGEQLVLTYTIKATDDEGGSDTQPITITITGTNDRPLIDAITATGGLSEIFESGNGTNELNATGTITISDRDTTDEVQLSETYNGDMIWSGGSIMADQLSTTQIQALIDGFTLNDNGFIAINDATNTASSGWTYATTENLNFLAAGETLTFSYTVKATDDSATATAESVGQKVTITITGTNDQPEISAITATGTLWEPLGSGSGADADTNLTGLQAATGTITISDRDDTDEVQLSETYNSDMIWSGGPIASAPLSSGQIQALIDGFTLDDTGKIAINDASNTVDSGWAYATGIDLNFLAAGETLTFSYNVVATDDSNTATAASAPQKVSITINGTNDAPVISVVTVADNLGTPGIDESLLSDTSIATLAETDAGLLKSGTLTVTDADLSNTVSSSVTSVVLSGVTGGLVSGDVLSMLSVTPLTGLAAQPTDLHNLAWNFNSQSQAFNFLAAGESLVLTYTITSTDNSIANPLSDTQTVEITINGTNEIITGSGGNDPNLIGTVYVDEINGLGGDDNLFGLDGNDIFDGGAGNDTIDGGQGFDTAIYTGDTGIVVANLATGIVTHGNAFTDNLTSIEAVIGSPQADNITGNQFANKLVGGAGIDTIAGGDGNDFLYGGDGADFLSGGNGTPSLSDGLDTFIFNFGDTGIDQILDFNTGSGKDQIDLSSFFADGITATTAQAQLTLTTSGGNGHLFFNGNEVAQFNGVTTGSIDVVYDHQAQVAQVTSVAFA